MALRTIIVDDEPLARKGLMVRLQNYDDINVVAQCSNGREAIEAIRAYQVDLMFLDIQMPGLNGFQVIEELNNQGLKLPMVVFSTAYEQYAIKAFKVNSVDYLLKPINEEELSEAINKFNKVSINNQIDTNQIEGLMQLIQTKSKSYKSTYLVHQRDELLPIKTKDIAYFYIETGIVKGVTFKNKPYIIDKKLEDIESELNPQLFHRINRQFIINKNAVINVKFYFNSKLIINIDPPFSERIVVSKAKAKEVKNWLNT